MLKKIGVDDLRIGMHLHALGGSWIDHPFWKTKFVLSDPADLARVRESGVGECWIDTALGRDVEAVAPPAATAESVGPAAPPAAPDLADDAPRTLPVAIDDELARAAELLNRSRDVVESLLDDARLGRALQAEQCLPLVEEITGSLGRNPDAFVGLARLKTHDGYSYLHSVAVCALMVSLGRRLRLDDAAVRHAGLAGLLHDIGKAAIPLEFLNKPARLTAAEYDIVKRHAVHGHAMLSGTKGIPGEVLDVCLHHHERPDGRGYPQGLADAEISQFAKMGAVCDVYDAITSERPYKPGWDPAESLVQMAAWSRAGQFDSGVFRAFIDSLGVFPVGSLVRMRSGRLAVVASQNPGHLRAPCVKVFFSTRSQLPVPVECLDTSSPACTDRVVGLESNETWKFGHLDELWAGREVLAKTARARR